MSRNLDSVLTLRSRWSLLSLLSHHSRRSRETIPAWYTISSISLHNYKRSAWVCTSNVTWGVNTPWESVQLNSFWRYIWEQKIINIAHSQAYYKFSIGVGVFRTWGISFFYNHFCTKIAHFSVSVWLLTYQQLYWSARQQPILQLAWDPSLRTSLLLNDVAIACFLIGISLMHCDQHVEESIVQCKNSAVTRVEGQSHVYHHLCYTKQYVQWCS